MPAQSPSKAIPGAVTALGIALVFAAPPAITGQASSSFKVSAQLGAAGAPGAIAVCRADDAAATVACSGTGTGVAVPAVAPVADVPAAQAPAAPISNPGSFRSQAVGSARPGAADMLARPPVLLIDEGTQGMPSAVAQTRLVSWGGRDYLEMMLSW